MKIIKFKQKRSYSYKRKVLIKDLVLNILVGIHNFEKKKKQRVKFNLIINNYYGNYYEADDYYDFSYSSRIRRFDGLIIIRAKASLAFSPPLI